MEIRAMLPEEAETLLHYARQSFPRVSLEQMGISRPKRALVATVNGEIAGAMFIKTFEADKKIGYLDLGFVRPEYRGAGVGNALYPAAVQALKAEGCAFVTAQVKDDNVASWGLLKKQGFSMPGMIRLFRMLGFRDALFLWLNSLYFISSGMNMWVSKTLPEPGGKKEIAAFFLINALLSIPYFVLRWDREPLPILGAFFSILLISLLFGFIGTRFSRNRHWRFRMNRGGLTITVFIGIMQSFFPVMGRWYPEKYEKSKEFRRDMGVQALCEWIGVLLAAIPGLFLDIAFFSVLSNFAFTLLAVHIIFFFPFEYFGGGRIMAWNKAIFVLMALATAGFMIFG